MRAQTAATENATAIATNMSAVDTMFDELALDDLTDVSTDGASSGQFLSYNGTSWAAATAPVGSSSVQLLSVTNSGKTITVTEGSDVTTTDIPVVVSGSVVNENLLLELNGSASDVVISLSSLIADANTFDLTVNNVPQI